MAPADWNPHVYQAMTFDVPVGEPVEGQLLVGEGKASSAPTLTSSNEINDDHGSFVEAEQLPNEDGKADQNTKLLVGQPVLDEQ